MARDLNLEALDSMRGDEMEGMEGADPERTNPMRGAGDGTHEVFLDRGIFAKTKVKPGQEVWVRGKVTSLGSTIGFAPTAVKAAGGSKEPEDGERYDPDLDDDMNDGDGYVTS